MLFEDAKEKCRNLCRRLLSLEDVVQLKGCLSELPPSDQFSCYDAYLNNRNVHDAQCLCVHEEEFRGYCSILNLLPDSFIDYGIEEHGKWNILHFAAQSDKAGLVEKLVADHGKLAKLCNSKEQTPLMLAVKSNFKIETSKVLLKTADPETLNRVLVEALDKKVFLAGIDSLTKSCVSDSEHNNVLKGALNKTKGGVFNTKLEIVKSVLAKMKEASISVSVEHLQLSLSFSACISRAVSDQLTAPVSSHDYIAIVSKCLEEGNMGEDDFRALEKIIDSNGSYHQWMFDNINKSNFDSTADNILSLIAFKVTKGSPVVEWYNTQDPRGKAQPLFELFLHNKSYLSRACVADSSGETLGHHAAHNNNTFLLQHFYQHRVLYKDVLNKEDRGQKKPLYYYPAALQLLSDEVIDDEILGSLRQVCSKANQNILQRLALRFSNADLPHWKRLAEMKEFDPMFKDTDRFGNTLLHYALSNHTQPAFLKLLLTKCTDCVNVENRYGWSPLHFVIRYGETGSKSKEKKLIENITLLKEAGADLNSSSYCTAYELALHKELPESVTELLATVHYPDTPLELEGKLWFLEEVLEKAETVEVVWTVGHVQCQELQIEVVPGGDWLTHYRHYTNPILALWEGLDSACVSKERLTKVWISREIEHEFSLEHGKCLKVATTLSLEKEETGLVDWLKEQGMMGLHSDEEISGVESVLSFGDVFERFTKNRLQNGTEESVRRMLEKLTSLKLILSLSVHGVMYIVSVQRFVLTMQCQYKEVQEHLKEFLGAALWEGQGQQLKSKKEPAFSLSLALYCKEELQSATLLYQPLCVALMRILAPHATYREGDSVELYLAKHTVTLSLVTTTVTVTADTKAFAARLVYAMSLALHQTQILCLHPEFSVRFLCSCLQDTVGMLDIVQEEEEYKPPVLGKCGTCNREDHLPAEDKSKPNANTRLSDITLAKQLTLPLASNQELLELQTSFSLEEQYLKVESARCKQTALFYSIMRNHGDTTLSAFYRGNMKEFKKNPEVGSAKEGFAIELLTIHDLEQKHTMPWHQKFHYRWLGVTSLISVLMCVIVVGVDQGIGWDLGYSGLSVIPAVFGFSGVVFALKLKLKRKVEYLPVEGEEEGEEVRRVIRN